MWFLCQRRDVRPRSEWTVSRDEHLIWMKQQHEDGRIVMSGPAPGRGMSMYLIRAANPEEARAIASADPFTRAGLCDFDLIHWEVHQILGIGPFSDQAIAAGRVAESTK